MANPAGGPGRTSDAGGRKRAAGAVRADTSMRAAAAAATENEVELKFGVPEAARDSLVSALERLGCRTARLRAHYFDSPDGCLAAAGISLRLRQEDQRWLQTLKVAGGGIHDRLEHEVEVPPLVADAPPAPDISRHAKSQAAAVLQRARAERGPPELTERYATDVLRRSCEIVEGDARIEIAFDEGYVIAGALQAPVCELELKSGSAPALCAAALPWVGRFGLWLASESKAARGERLVGTRDALPVVKASPPRLDAAMSAETMLRAIVRSCADQIVANAGAVAAGSRDHEHIHQLRVGLRRLRTALRELGDLSGDVDSGWDAPIAETFAQLGAFRDRETVMETLKPRLIKAGAAGVDWMMSDAPADDPVLAVRDPRFQTALLGILAFALAPDTVADAEPGLPERLRARLKSLHRRVVDDGARFRHLSEPDQHRVRKRLKRLRYLSEFVASLFHPPAVASYLDHLRPAQDALGLHNDYAVAAEIAQRAAGRGDADARFALGWLRRQQRHSTKASHQALAELADATRFWQRPPTVH